MVSLSQAKQLNAGANLPPKPVALFIGGTSGIGKCSAQALARYAKGNIHIIIVGRNEEAARQIISSFPRSSESNYEFISCDVRFMSNVSSVIRSLSSRLSKINYLILSTGYLSTEKYTATPDGIDQKLAVLYYSRFKFIRELLPLLQEAKKQGEPARAMNILAAGQGAPVDLNDLGLKKGYNSRSSFRYSPGCTELATEEFAKRNPNISFIHIFPGFVDTPIVHNFWVTKYFIWLLKFIMKQPEDCAEWMLLPLLDDTFQAGAFHLNEFAEPLPPKTLYLNPESQKVVFEHSVEAVSSH